MPTLNPAKIIALLQERIDIMGMFDDITCEKELPGLTEKIAFQTKDTPAQYLEPYAITEAGRLVHILRECHDVPENERPLYGTPEFDMPGSMSKLFGSVKWVKIGEEDLNYHGWLNFYGNDSKGEWWEFNAKFTDGVMVEVVRVESNG